VRLDHHAPPGLGILEHVEQQVLVAVGRVMPDAGLVEALALWAMPAMSCAPKKPRTMA
jgi:hypothetical protein